MSDAIREKEGINPDADGGIPDWMLQTVFTSGKVQIGSGGEIDITNDVEAVINSVSDQIITFIKSVIGNPLGYQAIIFIGGGALVFRQALEKSIKNAYYLDEFSNARGALKYMLKADRAKLLQGLDVKA